MKEEELKITFDEKGELIYSLTNFKPNPQEIRSIYADAGEDIIGNILVKNKKTEAALEKDFNAVFDAIIGYYVLPSIFSEKAIFSNMLDKAHDDLKKKKLQPNEILSRLIVQLNSPTKGKEIDKDEKQHIKQLAEGGWGCITHFLQVRCA